ncbi:hypothetical protein E4U59_005060 [Claviceps monticola]|nr:hypothetical protein E4U59_005060 [Claviceps monticola]
MERLERRCHRIRLDQAGEKTSSDFAITGLAVNGYGVMANTAQQIGTAILPCRTGSKLIYLTLPMTPTHPATWYLSLNSESTAPRSTMLTMILF